MQVGSGSTEEKQPHVVFVFLWWIVSVLCALWLPAVSTEALLTLDPTEGLSMPGLGNLHPCLLAHEVIFLLVSSCSLSAPVWYVCTNGRARRLAALQQGARRHCMAPGTPAEGDRAVGLFPWAELCHRSLGREDACSWASPVSMGLGLHLGS